MPRRTIQQVRAARQQFFVDHGREAQDHDLVEQMNLSVSDLRCWQQATSPTLSLNQIVSDSNNATLAETLPDPNPLNLLQQTSQRIIAAQLNTALSVLNEREQLIIMLRYGLDDGFHRSLADVAKQLSVSRETVRQIEKRAFRKLLATPNFMQLRDHLEPME